MENELSIQAMENSACPVPTDENEEAKQKAATTQARKVQKEYVCALLTDKFGAINSYAFEDVAKGKKAYQLSSPLYASILYIRQKSSNEKEDSIKIGAWDWIPLLKYGSTSGIKGIESIAQRVLLGLASGFLITGDISRGHIHSSSPSSTYRFMTMPMRLTGSAAKAIARQKIHGPKRTTWNASYEAAVTVLRSAAQNVPRNIHVMRFFTDGVSVPGAFLPSGCLRATEKILYKKDDQTFQQQQIEEEESIKVEEDIDENKDNQLYIQECEWIWPRNALTPEMKVSSFSRAFEVKDDFVHLHLADMLRNKARLVVLYLHGGAFALCGRGTHRELAFRFALACGDETVVCLPEYRRPPEASLSEALRDAQRVYDRILSYGVPRSRIIFAGDSAGGGLVLALLSVLNKKQMPAAAILLSPWVDLDEPDRPDQPLASRNCNQRYDFLPRDLIDFFSQATKAQSQSHKIEIYKRLYSNPEDMKHFPPLLIHVGQCEVLYDQVISLPIPKQAHLVVWRDMVHVSPCFAAFHDNPRQQLRMCGNFARAMVPPRTDKMNYETHLQIDIVAATIAVDTSTSMLGLFSSTYLTACLGDNDTWYSTEACRGYESFEDDKDVLNFDFGGNGNCATIILPGVAPQVLLQIRCNSAIGGTRLLATLRVNISPDLSLQQTVPARPLYLDDEAGAVHLAINLVSDSSFVAPPGTIVDHNQVQSSTKDFTIVPAHDAPPNENPQRFHFDFPPQEEEETLLVDGDFLPDQEKEKTVEDDAATLNTN